MQGILGNLIVWWVASFWIWWLWPMAEGIVPVLKCNVPNPAHRGIENLKMYAIKHIKICAKFRDIVLRASVGLSGTPALRLIGLNPGFWQTRLGLRYHVPVFRIDLNLYNPSHIRIFECTLIVLCMSMDKEPWIYTHLFYELKVPELVRSNFV